MPSLRGHMVFMSVLRDALTTEMPDLGAVVAAHWPAALVGSEGPDGWFFTGQKRPDTHMLDANDPSTWGGAIDRWLDQHAEVRPGRRQPSDHASFLAGYLSHLGLDTWGEQYQHPALPKDLRDAAPARWYPAALADPARVKAALRRLGEAPFPAERLVSSEAIAAVSGPARFNPDAVRRVAAGIAPSLPLTDPWEISRVNPLREMPGTLEAHQKWQQDRAAVPEATDAEYQALLSGASAFTIAALKKWW